MVEFTQKLREEYLSLWRTMEPLAGKGEEAIGVSRRLLVGLPRYLALEKRLNIPAAFIMCVHERESAGAWGTYLGNGQRLDRPTTLVPKGRGPFDDFEDGAYDALHVVQHMGNVPLNAWDAAGLAWYLEKMNGFGYRFKGLNSPYLWGGTNHQQPGKYIADGYFDPSVVDRQLGGMLIYWAIVKLHPELVLGGTGEVRPAPMPEAIPEFRPTSPMPPIATREPTLWERIVAFFRS